MGVRVYADSICRGKPRAAMTVGINSVTAYGNLHDRGYDVTTNM